MSVKIKRTEDNAVVTPYSGNSEYGYVVLTSIKNVFVDGWMQVKERSTLIRGTVEGLTQAFSETSELPGNIAVSEYVASEIPSRISKGFNKELSFEEQIEPFIKRAGAQDAPILKLNGETILRFTDYDPTGTKADIRVEHDNGAEVASYNAAKTTSVKSDDADL